MNVETLRVGSSGLSTSNRLVRVLMVHNRYQLRGGEDSVYEAEVELLRSHGHEVRTYERSNDDIVSASKSTTAIDTLWSRRTVGEIDALCGEFQPDVVHCHNTFPLISPSVYWAVERRRVPVVQTLHNFRLLCVQAMLLRNDRVCEDCIGRLPWRGVMHGCYRGSHMQSAVACAGLALHRAVGTYAKRVAKFVALNDFCRRKFIQGGLPADKLVVKPNFIDLKATPGERIRANGLYVGRLSKEKGVDVLARALRSLRGTVQVDVIGTGPEEGRLKDCPGVRMLGWVSASEVLERMQGAQFLVMPSIWYENFPRTLVEAYACGLPVVASRLGALAELVAEGRTGVLFDSGSAESLAEKLQFAAANPGRLMEMGVRARQEYEGKYTAAKNYETLLNIYTTLIAQQSTASTVAEPTI